MTGNSDGNNTVFFTYDKKFFPDTLEIYINDELVTSGYTVSSETIGQITFDSAPDINSEVRASYYWQWWTDADLKNFLNKGAEQIGISIASVTNAASDTAYLQVPGGLKTPTLLFAAYLANTSLVSYLVTRKHSSEFLLEQDGNTDSGYNETVKLLKDSADSFMKQSIDLADRFYKRQGRQFAPAFGIKNVNTKVYGPTR